MFSTKTVAAFAAFAAAVSALPTGTTGDEVPSGTLSAPLSKRTEHYGVATYYTQGGQAGSCGQVHGDHDYIGALSPYWMNQGTFCGRTITITNNGGGQSNPGTGKQVKILVADTCPGCDENHIDLSIGAFEGLTDGNLDPPGEFNIHWHFNAQ